MLFGLVDEVLNDPGELEALLLSVHGEEEVGENLSAKVAETFQYVTSQQLKKEEYETLRKTYKVPGNCKSLLVPKVNQEIWKNPALPKRVKILDARAQSSQLGLSKAMIALARATDNIIQNAKNIQPDLGKSLMSDLLSATKLLGSTFSEMSVQRRQLFKPLLTVDLSSQPQAPSELLFGDDLEGRVKQTRNTSKLLKDDSTPRRTSRFSPYPSSSARSYQRGTPQQNFRSNSLNYQRPPMWKGGGYNKTPSSARTRFQK